MTVRAAHQMGRDSSILTCITRHFTWRYIILWKCFSERESLDLNLQEHRAVQTLLKCFSKPSTPKSMVLSLWGFHILPPGQDNLLLQNLRIHYGVHNSLSLVLSWARWIWCTPLILYLFKIQSTIMLLSVLKSLPSRFSEWNVTYILILLMYVMCPAHLILLALTILILFDDHIGIHIHLFLNTEWPKSQLID